MKKGYQQNNKKYLKARQVMNQHGIQGRNGVEDMELVNHTKVIFNTKNLIMVLSSLLMSPCLNFKSFKSYSSLLYMSFIMMNIYYKMKIFENM